MQLSHSVIHLYSCFFHRGAGNSDLDIPPGFWETVCLRKRTCLKMYLTWVKIYTSVAEKSYFLRVRMSHTLSHTKFPVHTKKYLLLTGWGSDVIILPVTVSLDPEIRD